MTTHAEQIETAGIMLRRGHRPDLIAAKLDALGVPAPNGRSWRVVDVRALVETPVVRKQVYPVGGR